jgi:eukaryotic-like serine/threonine-protein kinase
MDHPPDDVLARLAEGELRSEGELAEHLRTCAACTEVLSGLVRARTGALEETARSPLASTGPRVRHDLIGRYRVERLLGEGAMGQVFEALDPELTRRVAVKVVRGASSAELRARLLREAQTAARLRHPNIVTVHDAGTVDEEVFIAMELVPGGSLRGWLSRPRAWREVLSVFLGAGRGLAAVHGAGLVHRDFKPDNVLLDLDGTARVSDFGLVGAEPGASSSAEGPVGLTRTGMMLGTPAYMSPELFAGEAATPLSDQFAYCASLFEALAGERPFRASSLPELKQALRNGQMVPLPAQVPQWLVRVLRRGLSANPAQRFGSMLELLAVLENTPRLRRQRASIAIATAAVVSLVTVSSILSSGSDARRCRQGASRIDSVWNEAQRAAVSAGFRTIPSPYAEPMLRAVLAELDGFSRDWRAMQLDACEATRVRGEQSDQLLDLRVQCLDGRLTSFSAALRTLQQLGPDELENALRVAQLGGLTACADTRALANTTPPPATVEDRSKLAAIRATLADASALTELGRARAALPTAEKAVLEGRALGFRPVEAEALLALGTAQLRLGAAAAAQTLADSALAAEAGRSDPTLVAALLLLSELKLDSAPKEARELIRRARAVLERLRDDELVAQVDLAEASLLILEVAPERSVALMDALLARRTAKADSVALAAEDRRAAALHKMGRLKEALEGYQRLALGQETLQGRQHPLTLAALKNVAALKDSLSDFDGARAVLGEVIARLKETFGEIHPLVARALVNLANSWFHQGNSKEAAPLYEKALTIFEQASSEPSIAKSTVMGNLSAAYSELGRGDEALELQKRSLELRANILGGEHPEVAYALSNLAAMQRANHQLAEAIATLDRALTIQRKVLPRNHPDLAYSLFLSADLRGAEGKPQLARQLAVEAFEAFRVSVGAEATQTVAAESFIAGLDLAAGHAALALPVFERVQKVYDATGNQSSDSALNHLRLAEALIATHASPARVCREAALSKAQYAAEGERAKELAEVERLLRKSRCPP